jgi:hypothetical protein
MQARASLVASSAVLVLLSAAGCDGVPSVPEQGSGPLTIQSTRSAFDKDAVTISIEEGPDPDGGIHATIENLGQQVLYARLGDAFNAAPEELYAAAGSDGHVDRLEDGEWTEVPAGAILFEGVSEVALQPGRRQPLTAWLGSPSRVGYYRIRIVHSDVPDGTPAE